MRVSGKSMLLSLVILGGLLFIVGGSLIWWMMQQPMFKPGTVAQREDLKPVGINGEYWQVTPDVKLKTFSTGEGRNILFIHGGPGIPTMASAPGFDLLSDEYRINYYDQRGVGRSTRPFDRFPAENSTWTNIQLLESTLGISQQLADIERIRQLLGDDQMILIGHSYGALLASLYAAEFPDHIEKLVLLNPADLLVFPSGNKDMFATIRERLPDRDRKAYDKWQRRYLDLGQIFKEDEASLQKLDTDFLPYFIKATGDTIQDAPPVPQELFGSWHTRAQFFGLGKRHDWSSNLVPITADTLIIHGGKDFQPLAVSQTYAEAIPNAKLEEIPNAAHFPHFNNPEELAEQLRPFLSN